MTSPRPGTKAHAVRLADAEASLMVRHRELAHITAALIEKEAEVEAQARRIKTLETQLAQAQQDVVHAQGIVDYNLAELQSIRASTSWRMMAPIRILGRLFGR